MKVRESLDIREFKSAISSRSEILNKYLDDIRKYPVLTVQEEIELIDEIKNGSKEARDKIINCNQRFVFAIAKRYCNTEEVMDLVSEGNIGLMDAINRFDPTKGMRFLSYAVWYIRRSIVYYLMNDNVMIKKSNNAKCNNKINIIKNKYFCENGSWPTDDEIIDIMKEEFDIDITNKADVYELKTNSINSSYTNDDDKTFEESPEFVYKTHSRNDYEQQSENEFYETVAKGMITKLSDRERKIIELAFGINCEKEYSNYEIGQIMGITSERARQIKHEAIAKMRNLELQKFA